VGAYAVPEDRTADSDAEDDDEVHNDSDSDQPQSADSEPQSQDLCDVFVHSFTPAFSSPAFSTPAFLTIPHFPVSHFQSSPCVLQGNQHLTKINRSECERVEWTLILPRGVRSSLMRSSLIRRHDVTSFRQVRKAILSLRLRCCRLPSGVIPRRVIVVDRKPEQMSCRLSTTTKIIVIRIFRRIMTYCRPVTLAHFTAVLADKASVDKRTNNKVLHVVCSHTASSAKHH